MENCFRSETLTWRFAYENLIEQCSQEDFPGCASGKRPTCQCKRYERRRFHPWVGKIPRKRERLPPPVFLGFPCGSAGKESACNSGDLGSIPGLGRPPGEGKGYPLQYSGLENSMDYSIVHGVAKSQTRLSGFHLKTIHL